MKFTAAIDEYLADMKAQGRINSPRTERSYFSRLAMHADDVNNRDPRATGRQDVKRTLRRWSHRARRAFRGLRCRRGRLHGLRAWGLAGFWIGATRRRTDDEEGAGAE